MPKCMYPQFAPLTAYCKRCRCLRCVEEKRKKDKLYNQSKKGKMYRKLYEASKTAKESQKRYRQSKKGKVTNINKTSRRRAKIKCPLSLGDKEQIRLIYEECYRITQETGIPHHVDHIIPLALGGLHHPSNLQILTAEENMKKGCKLISDARGSPQPDEGSPCHQG